MYSLRSILAVMNPDEVVASYEIALTIEVVTESRFGYDDPRARISNMQTQICGEAVFELSCKLALTDHRTPSLLE